jgi:hypothetical protein
MPQDTVIENVRLRSDEVNEILGKPPKTVYRLGNSIVIILLLILIGVSSIIKYPITLKGEVEIHAIKDLKIDTFKVSGAINIENAASLKLKQRLMIELKAYPSRTYGKLTGIVLRIEPFTSDRFVRYAIKLDRGLKTDKGYIIKNQPLLTGNALIIVEENSILKSLLSSH